MAANSTEIMPSNPPVMATNVATTAKHLFQPGHAPYKPKGIMELRAMAKGMSLQMMQVIYSIALDEDERGAVRIAAADMILTRAWGKAEAHHHDRGDETTKATELSSSQILAMLEEVKVSANPQDIEPPMPVVLSDSNSVAISDCLQLTQDADMK